MRIKRKDLNRLIENFLFETDRTDPKAGVNIGKVSSNYDDEKTDIGDSFMDAQTFKVTGNRPRNPEADIQAVTDLRKGSDRGRFPPMGFGDMEGVNTVVRDYHEPNDDDVFAAQQYSNDPYNLGPQEKSVHDLEHTIHSPDIDEDTDEDTDEDPRGTQYSLEDTLEIPDYSSDFDDDRDDSQDVVTYEDEEGRERTFMGGEEVTPESYDLDDSLISKIRKFLSRK